MEREGTDRSRPRQCARPGCANAAAASLSYDYGARKVWVGDLAEPSPACHDLCLPHADRLRVPRGWEKDDIRRRVEQPPRVVPHRAPPVPVPA